MVDVRHDVDRRRYECWIDGQLAGFSAYRLTDESVVFTHTEVFPEFEGRGVGSVIAAAALDDVRATGGRSVVPRCPFIRSWIERHPGYADLVAPEQGAD